jgi:hypothetical protein
MSNIILYCFAARRFRHELEHMIKVWINTIKKRLPCYSSFIWKNSKQIRNQSNDENSSSPSKLSFRRFKTFRRRKKEDYDYIEFKLVSSPSILF